MQAQNIDEVIAYLDQIITTEVSKGSKLVYFPILYRKVTQAIKVAIEQGEFEDNPRMEVFDVVFANKYIKAYQDWKDGKKVPISWQSTFDVRNQKLTTLQHLVIGMNAHINFDLGIAAATVAPKEKIYDLKADFDEINVILNKLVNNITERRSAISKASRPRR